MPAWFTGKIEESLVMKHEFRDGTLYVPCDALRGELAPATVMNGRFTRSDGSVGFRPLLAFADLDCQLLAGSCRKSDEYGNLPEWPEYTDLIDEQRILTDEQAFIDRETSSRVRNVDLSAEREASASEKERRVAAMALIAADAEAAGIPLADAIV